MLVMVIGTVTLEPADFMYKCEKDDGTFNICTCVRKMMAVLFVYIFRYIMITITV